MTDRVPPQNIEAEMALLGSVLVDREMMVSAGGIVHASDFYAHVHGTIFESIKSLHDRGEPVDKITVAEELGRREKLAEAGGISYLSSLMDTVQTAASAEYYAKIVREKSMLRGLIHAGTNITQLGYESEEDVEGAVTASESLIRGIINRGVRPDEGTDASYSLTRILSQLSKGVTGAQKTPWPSLDEMTGGFFPGELIGWVGGQKIGKSAALLNLADYLSAHEGMVLYVTLEMDTDDTVRRMLAMYSGISARRQRQVDLQGDDWDRIGDSVESLANRQVRFLGAPRSVNDIRSVLARLNPPAVACVIDHVSFLEDARPRKSESRVDALERCYYALRAVAVEFRIVLHAVQHLNRQGQQFEGHDQEKKMIRPSANDIRFGGNLEGVAHAVIIPYREKPFPDASTWERRVGEFIVAANRDGNPGQVKMDYDGTRSLWLEEGQRPWWQQQQPAAATVTSIAVEPPVDEEEDLLAVSDL